MKHRTIAIVFLAAFLATPAGAATTDERAAAEAATARGRVAAWFGEVWQVLFGAESTEGEQSSA